MKNIALIVLLIILIIIGPILFIWALNTLFPALAIPYTIWAWFAVIILSLTLTIKKN